MKRVLSTFSHKLVPTALLWSLSSFRPSVMGFVLLRTTRPLGAMPRRRQFASSSSRSTTRIEQEEEEEEETNYRSPAVSWYPGHIAKAERQLSETLSAVDVVVEVRDARFPAATRHPRVTEWCAGKPRVVLLTHCDCIPDAAAAAWQFHLDNHNNSDYDTDVLPGTTANQAKQAVAERNKYTTSTNHTKQQNVVPHFFVNARTQIRMRTILKHVRQAASHVQARRQARGLQPRALRLAVLGFPNVGKSAVLNRLLGGKKRAASANIPGVTRSLQWIRVATDKTAKSDQSRALEVLDSPGIIPAQFNGRPADAALLAAGNCVGNAAYDDQRIASFLAEWMLEMKKSEQLKETYAPEFVQACQTRYGIVLDHHDSVDTIQSGDDFLYRVADNACRGSLQDAARKILQDFRTGRWGRVCLQPVPIVEKDETNEVSEQAEQVLQQQRQRRVKNAVETAKQRGLELPPSLVETTPDTTETSEVGKGMFEGW